MAAWQWKRWEPVAQLGAGKPTLPEAARVLSLSVRQARRIRRAVERAGRAGCGMATPGKRREQAARGGAESDPTSRRACPRRRGLVARLGTRLLLLLGKMQILRLSFLEEIDLVRNP